MADTGEHTGGMLALVPDNADALAVEGGDPAGELHLTLLYLGDDVTGWGEGQADRLRELGGGEAGRDGEQQRQKQQQKSASEHLGDDRVVVAHSL